jgi:Uma2 family endonuclease
MAATFGPSLSLEEYLALPVHDGLEEVIDGRIEPLATPSHDHNDAAYRLASLVLGPVLPRELRVILGPSGTFIRRSPLRVREPDLKIIRWADCDPGHTFVDTPPVLVVEVISALHGRRRDLVEKRHDYAVAGVPSYWIVDLENVSVHVLELRGEQYRDTALVEGDELLQFENPFPVTFRPSDLVPRPPP